jgi:hypothetical protein
MSLSFATRLRCLLLSSCALPACMQFIPTVYAQSVNSLTCNPAVITGGSGATATCTVTLGAVAPAGGTEVMLASSLIELAASLPRVVVPAGQITAEFAVATNPMYRRYSRLAFTADIRATANGTTQSATLNITPQPLPADFSSGSQAGSNTQWQGSMCGGIAPIGGYPGILYDCSAATGTGFGSCTFRQECAIGCRRAPPNAGTYNDFCATSGPNPVAITRNYIVSGDSVPATVVAEAPAGGGPSQEQGVPRILDPNYNATMFPHVGIPFPTGAGSVSFNVATSYVPSIQFVDVTAFWFNDSIPPFLITNGRAGQTWLTMLPPDPPPAVSMPTLGDFKITGSNPVTGGQSSIGQIDLSGLSRVGGPTITITSSHPDIVPPSTVNAPASEQLLGFQVPIATKAPAADTDVKLTATDGRYNWTATLTVRVPPPPPVLSGVSVNPGTVVGGNPSTGTVTLSAQQSGATTIALSTAAPANVATLPLSVTVPAGATTATFPISTFAVTETFNMNVFADLAGSPGRQALLMITAGATPPPPPALSTLSVNPTSLVGGASSIGTVTLSTAAPAGGATITLSENSTAITVPASVSVPAGATSATFTLTTVSVRAATTATISASYSNLNKSAALTINPPPPKPVAPTLAAPANAATVPQPVVFDWSDVANATSYELQVANSSSVASPFVANPTGSVSQATVGGLPATQLWWRVRAQNSAGVWGPYSVVRTLTPQAGTSAATLTSVTSSPPTILGGNSTTGTVTLTAAAPNGGAVVSLSTSSADANVPPSVTIPAGATSATFAVTTRAVSTNIAVTLTAAYNSVSRATTLNVTTAATSVTLTVSATGRSGEQVTSAPAGINVTVGATASAPFATNTQITLGVASGRDAIWSGACSSGGGKAKSCAFTLTANASVSASVQ